MNPIVMLVIWDLLDKIKADKRKREGGYWQEVKSASWWRGRKRQLRWVQD